MSKLSHIDKANRPTMVDVGGKTATARTAVACSHVFVPDNVASALKENAGRSKKGPVFDTAIIAGVMAAKKTHELIPFCHPLGLENCKISIEFVTDNKIEILCQVSVTHKTGVEMEALTGASVAALTIYDMCKALSHDIEIQSTKLVQKTGGKSDYGHP